MIITINDIRLAGHCGEGARAWFRRHFAPDGRRYASIHLALAHRVDALLRRAAPRAGLDLGGGDVLAR